MSTLLKSNMLLSLTLLLGTACQTAPKEENAAEFDHETAVLIEKLSSENSMLANLFESAAGYAIFPVVGEGGLLIATGWGRGEVFEEGELIGYASVSEHSIGAVVGGEKWTLLIFFETNETLEEFEQGKFIWNAKADAVAGGVGASTDTKYKDGVLLLHVDPAGLMGNASAGFSNYKFVSLTDAFK